MKKEISYPNIENCNPSGCVSANVMKCNRIIANIFRKYLKPFEITDSQLSILFVITKAKLVTQKMISEILYMEKSTVNRNIVRLINKDYISLDTNLSISTTEKGKIFLEKLIPQWDIAMTEINEILGKEGVTALYTLTNKLKI